MNNSEKINRLQSKTKVEQICSSRSNFRYTSARARCNYQVLFPQWQLRRVLFYRHLNIIDDMLLRALVAIQLKLQPFAQLETIGVLCNNLVAVINSTVGRAPSFAGLDLYLKLIRVICAGCAYGTSHVGDGVTQLRLCHVTFHCSVRPVRGEVLVRVQQLNPHGKISISDHVGHVVLMLMKIRCSDCHHDCDVCIVQQRPARRQ